MRSFSFGRGEGDLCCDDDPVTSFVGREGASAPSSVIIEKVASSRDFPSEFPINQRTFMDTVIKITQSVLPFCLVFPTLIAMLDFQGQRAGWWRYYFFCLRAESCHLALLG